MRALFSSHWIIINYSIFNCDDRLTDEPYLLLLTYHQAHAYQLNGRMHHPTFYGRHQSLRRNRAAISPFELIYIHTSLPFSGI